jgi:DNA-binding NtrC family response regulator
VKGRRALVVDDDVLVREIIGEMLTQLGFQAREAQRADEAFGLVTENEDRWELALVDLYLPDGRGDNLVAGIRAVHRHLPLILMTGGDAVRQRARFAADKLVHVLEKPFGLATLCRSVEDLGAAVAAARE